MYLPFTNRFVGSTGAIETFSASGRTGLTSSATQIFYADPIANVVGSIDQQTKQPTGVPLTGLRSPLNVRYDAASGLLFFIEQGTAAGHYNDGRLQAVVPALK
jgi:hypothetical protein